MKGIDIVGLLKYMDEQKKSGVRSDAAKKRNEPIPHVPAGSLIGLLQERRAENQMIDAFFKDIEKLGKKEEEKKKGDKIFGNMSAPQIATLLWLSFPFYWFAVNKMLGTH